MLYLFFSLKTYTRLRRYHRWRQHADPLCDEALGILFPGTSSSTGIDLLTALEQHTESKSSEDAAWLFYDTVSQIPPPDVCVTEEEYKTAVAFFLDHAIQISQALSYYSLAGGFARCHLLYHPLRRCADSLFAVHALFARFMLFLISSPMVSRKRWRSPILSVTKRDRRMTEPIYV